MGNLTNEFNFYSISDQAHDLYVTSCEELEDDRLTFHAAHGSFKEFKKEYQFRHHDRGSKWRKLAAIPAALSSFLIKAPYHLIQSGYQLFKHKHLESKSNAFKAVRDLQEGMGDLAYLIDDKLGCYLVYDAHLNKKTYDTALELIATAPPPKEEPNPFEQLPPEILLQVFQEVKSPEFLQTSATLKKQIYAAADKSNLFERQYQEVIQQLTWAEDYLNHIDFADKPPREKLEAIYKQLLSELQTLEKATNSESNIDHKNQGPQVSQYLKQHPKKINPLHLHLHIKEVDQWLEDFTLKNLIEPHYRNFDNPNSLFGPVHVNSLELRWNIATRIPRKIFETYPDIETLSIHHLTHLLFLPKEIGNLQSLKKLHITRSPLKYLPENIGALQSLEEFYIRECSPSRLPKSIGNLKSLRKLWVWPLNQLGLLTEIPAEIGDLSRLEELIICHQPELKRIPKEIGALSSLKTLSLEHNQIEELPHEIGNLSSIETLYLPGNQIAELPPTIGKLSFLKILNLAKNPLKKIPEELGDCLSLAILTITQFFLPLRTPLPKKIKEREQQGQLEIRR